MGYAAPNAPVSDTYWGHRNRNPPSPEPGTDYELPFGSSFPVAWDGTVAIVDHSNGGGEGRRLSIDLDDGRRVSYIHLSQIWGWVGQRVTRGQDAPALSGASGNGEDWFYGPHVHVTLHERPGMPYWDSIDFELHVGDDEPPPPPFELEDDMIRIQAPGRGIALVGPGYYRHLSSDEEVQNSEVMMSKHVSGNDRQFDLWTSMAVQGQVPPEPTPPPAQQSAHPLVGPAWVGGVLLGLIGLVEVIRLVVDVAT